jgi:kynurenine 3-monooxygenase
MSKPTPTPTPTRPLASNGRSAIISGCGLAGSLMACYLADEGWNVRVYERRPDPRKAGYVGGRSINLALSVRGLTGLRGAGLEETVLTRDAIRMPGRMMHAHNGATSFQPYSSDPGDAINSVSRGGLNLTLIKAAAARPNVQLFFDAPCTDADLPNARATFDMPGGRETVDADLLIGSDGAFSAVRMAFLKYDRFDYSQSYLRHAYKELHIPEARAARQMPNNALDRDAFAMEPNALHIWPRGAAMMIALPNRDGSFTCTLFWPFEGDHSFEHLEGPHAAGPWPRDIAPNRVRAFFEEHYADAVPLMPTLEADFARNPTSSLVTVRCYPWQRHGRSCLLGDAAHAIVPFYGQGMNAAFEDCLVLSRCLKEHRDQREALEAYEAARKPNADAIAEMAIENFVEMRDLAGRPDFQYRKRIEQTIHRELSQTHGERVTPQYNLVSFTTVPYWMAQRRGREMGRILETVALHVPPKGVATPGTPEWTRSVIEVAKPMLDTITPIPTDAALSVH